MLVETGVEGIYIAGQCVLISRLENTLLLEAHDGFYALPEQSGVIFDFHRVFLQIELLSDRMMSARIHFNMLCVKLINDVALHGVKVG